MTTSSPPEAESVPPASPHVAGGPAPLVSRRWDKKGKKNLIMVGCVVTVAALLMVLMFVGGKKDVERPSTIADSPGAQIQGVVSAEDKAALEAAERKRLDDAAHAHKSAVANRLDGEDGSKPEPTPAPAPQNGAAPQPSGLGTNANPSTQKLNFGDENQQNQNAQRNASLNADRLKGLEAQMLSLQNVWGIGDKQTGAAAAERVYLRELPKQADTAQAASITGKAINGSDKIVVPALDPVYTARVLKTFDSDTPGTIRARIITGPLAGGVVVGTAKRVGDGATFDFAEATYNGKTFKIAANGLDEKTSSDIIEGRYNGRYAQRFIFPIISAGVQAYAQARAQTGTEVVAIPVASTNGAVGAIGAQQTPPPSAEQARDAMIAGAAAQSSKILASGPQDGQVIIDSKSTIGIMFTEPVYESVMNGMDKGGGK